METSEGENLSCARQKEKRSQKLSHQTRRANAKFLLVFARVMLGERVKVDMVKL